MIDQTPHLPGLLVRVECSHCLDETEHDGDSHVCRECRLRFPEDIFSGDPAVFLDEEEDPCSAVSTLPVERYEHHGRDWTVTRAPCHLPAGHSSPHRYPETFTSEATQ